MRAGMSVGGDAYAIGLVGGPIDKASVMIRNEHCPLRLRQLPYALLAHSRGIEGNIMAALAIRISARVDRICQDMIDCSVAGVDPADSVAIVAPHRK